MPHACRSPVTCRPLYRGALSEGGERVEKAFGSVEESRGSERRKTRQWKRQERATVATPHLADARRAIRRQRRALHRVRRLPRISLPVLRKWLPVKGLAWVGAREV